MAVGYIDAGVVVIGFAGLGAHSRRGCLEALESR